jgi:Tol biopolymer transport system component
MSIAFDSKDSTGKYDIYVLYLASGKISKLTSSVPTNCYCPTWSPDGSKIAFTVETSKGSEGYVITKAQTDIYVMDEDGGSPTLLIKDGMLPSWSRK